MSDDRLPRTTTVKMEALKPVAIGLLGTLVVNHYDTLLNLIPNDEISIELVAPFEFTRLPSMQLPLLRGGSVRRFAGRSFPSAEPEIAPSAVFPVSWRSMQGTRATGSSSRERHAAAISRPRSLPDDNYAAMRDDLKMASQQSRPPQARCATVSDRAISVENGAIS